MKTQREKKEHKSLLTKASEIIPLVKENLGIEKSLKIQALQEIWPLITSFDLAKYSKPSYFDKENNLVISTKSSVIAAELSVQKIDILNKLKEATKNTDITFKGIRFISK